MLRLPADHPLAKKYLQEARIKTKPKRPSRTTLAIRSLRSSISTGSFEKGAFFEAFWYGAFLLTQNEMLRLDHRALTGYRQACHKSPQEAVLTILGRHRFTFQHQVRLTLFRRAARRTDNDNLPAKFKALIDGFRKAGLIADDDPEHVSSIQWIQTIGKPMIGLRFDIAENDRSKSHPVKA